MRIIRHKFRQINPIQMLNSPKSALFVIRTLFEKNWDFFSKSQRKLRIWTCLIKKRTHFHVVGGQNKPQIQKRGNWINWNARLRFVVKKIVLKRFKVKYKIADRWLICSFEIIKQIQDSPRIATANHGKKSTVPLYRHRNRLSQEPETNYLS